MMNELEISNDCSRRGFIKGVLRYALAGGIVAVAGGLILKKGKVDIGGGCAKRKVCKGCALLAKCGLPQAAGLRDGDDRGEL